MEEKNYLLVKAVSIAIVAIAILGFVCVYAIDKRYDVANYDSTVVITDKWKGDAKAVSPLIDDVFWQRVRERNRIVDGL